MIDIGIDMGRIIIDLTRSQEKEVERMLKSGLYKTKSELIRDALRKLIVEEKRSKVVLRNGGEYEYSRMVGKTGL